MSVSTKPSTRRGRPEDREAAREARLLDTGLEVFGTQGYAHSAIEDICARAGVGTRSFYGHFESKEDLLVAVYDRIVARNQKSALVGLAAETADVEQHIRSGVRAWVETITADERAARIQLLEVVGVSPRLEARRREARHEFVKLVRHDAAGLVARGLMVRPFSPLLAIALVGGTNEILIEWLLAPRRPSRRQLVDEVTHLFVAVAR